MKLEAVIIRRSNDENTVALVTAEVDSTLIQTVNQLGAAVRHAVTAWVTQTEDSQNVVARTRGDLNIGDLAAECLGDEVLALELRARGVHKLEITCHVGEATHWDFDDNLFDPE